MNIKGITFKYGATIMILFLAVLLPLIYTLDHLFIAFYVNQKQEEIDHFATKYANKIFDIEDEKTYRTFEMSLEIINADLFVFNRDGKILKGTEVLGFKEGTQVMNDIFHPISNKHGVGMKYSEEKGEQSYLLSGKPIIIGNNVNGGLVVVSSMDEVNASIKQVRIWLFVSVIGALIVAIGFTFFISRKLSYPLLQMERATRELAKGKLRTKLSFQTKDEVGSLSTAIMDLERELEDYRTNRREFFANISHELRTPISYIKGYSMVLRDELYKNEKEKNQYLMIIHDESTRLTDLINDLFELAKMEEGKLDLNYARTDIADIINSSVRKINLKAKEKGIRITLNTPSDHTLLYTDGRRLEQIFINLLENAIQYSEPHSNIHVSTKVQKRDIQVLIKDSGIGIPKEDLPYIFERFYRVEKSRSRSTGGTGLGLSIVKNLVELLGGRIEITSSVGAGTIFKIYFPTSKEVSEKE